MRKAKLKCLNGYEWKTAINGTDQEIRKYFLGVKFETSPDHTKELQSVCIECTIDDGEKYTLSDMARDKFYNCSNKERKYIDGWNRGACKEWHYTSSKQLTNPAIFQRLCETCLNCKKYKKPSSLAERSTELEVKEARERLKTGSIRLEWVGSAENIYFIDALKQRYFVKDPAFYAEKLQQYGRNNKIEWEI